MEKVKEREEEKSKLVFFIVVLVGAILGIAFMEQMQIINIFPETLEGVTAYSVGANSVQTYFTFMNATNTTYLPFTGGQTGNNAVPFVTLTMGDLDNTNDFWNRRLVDVYFNSTGIIIQRVQSNGIGTNITNLTIRVNVVEFAAGSVRVQNGTFSLDSASVKTVGANLGTSVNTSRAALIFYYNSTDVTDDVVDNVIRGNITNSTFLNFSVDPTSDTGVKAGHWYVFESLDGSFTVQNVYLALGDAINSATTIINSVQTNKTFLIGSYTATESADDARDGGFSLNLSNSTAILGSRSASGASIGSLNATVFVITFTGEEFVQRDTFAYSAGTNDASSTITSVNTSLSMAWNPLLTGKTGDGSGGGFKLPALQYLNLTNSTTIAGHRDDSVSTARGSWEVIQWVATATNSNPQWANNATNGTTNGTFIQHSVNWTDDSALSGYIFSFANRTGVFVNDSFVLFSGTQNFSNVSKWVNTTVGAVVQWQVFANDSANNVNSTSIFNYTTISSANILGSNSKISLSGANNNLRLTGNSGIKIFR